MVLERLAEGIGEKLSIKEIPFNSETKQMITINIEKNEPKAFIKGACDLLIDKCSFIRINDKILPMTENLKKQINILKQYGILKTVQIEKPEYVDLSDQDIVIGEIPSYSSDFVYQFSFVGVVLLGKNVIICYPKYIDNEEKPFKKMSAS